MLKLRKYTSDMHEVVPITVTETIRGILDIGGGKRRRAIEIIVPTITAEELAILGSEWSIIEGTPPIDIASLMIDKETDSAISSMIHPVASQGEEFGILRDQMVQWGNKLGLEFTEDFTRLNKIAITAIGAARIKKESL